MKYLNVLLKLTTITTGSKGNCYLLEADGEGLILDAGAKYKDFLPFTNFDTSNISGLLCTHEHGDHAKYLKEFQKHIPIYTSFGTLKKSKIQWGCSDFNVNLIKDGVPKKIGAFTIYPLKSEHDAEEPLNFIILHPKYGRILFITDTYNVTQKMSNIDYLVIETNYSSEIIKNKEDDFSIADKRVFRSHLSIENAIYYTNLINFTRTIKQAVLIHLSSRNADEFSFKSDFERLTGVATEVAKNKQILILNSI